MRMWKRVIPLVLAVALLVSCMPGQAPTIRPTATRSAAWYRSKGLFPPRTLLVSDTHTCLHYGPRTQWFLLRGSEGASRHWCESSRNTDCVRVGTGLRV